QSRKKKKSKSEASKDSPAPNTNKAAISAKTKSAIAYEGLFTVYQDTTDGKTYMLINENQIGQEIIYWSYADNGLARVGLNRGAFRFNKVFKINRYFDRIDFELQNTGFYFDPEQAISKSSAANISPAILLSEKIVAEDKGNGKILIEAGNLFMDE